VSHLQQSDIEPLADAVARAATATRPVGYSA
jgi:hypothetical protein